MLTLKIHALYRPTDSFYITLGKDLVSPAMLEFIVQQSVNSAVSDGLSRTAAKSSKDANILFGWQVLYIILCLCISQCKLI